MNIINRITIRKMENVDGRTDGHTDRKTLGVSLTRNKCLVTRAVHLDLVPTLSSDDFYW